MGKRRITKVLTNGDNRQKLQQLLDMVVVGQLTENAEEQVEIRRIP